MPYNSSSFEKQLAKYKQAQAEKVVADMPRKKYEVYEDPHQVKSKIAVDRGAIKSYALDPVQMMGEGGQTAPIANKVDLMMSPIIVKRKKPLYKRVWFILLVVTTLPTFAAPILFKDEWNQMMGIAASIKTSTGVDPMAVSTYTNMLKRNAAPAAEPAVVQGPAPVRETESALDIKDSELAEPMDMHNAVQRAQEKADSITSQGTGYSMKYIEEESRRLNDMAKEFDAQYKK